MLDDVPGRVAQCFSKRAAKTATPIHAVRVSDYAKWLRGQKAAVRAWLGAVDFKAKKGQVALIPGGGGGGGVEKALWLYEPDEVVWSAAACAEKLPPGRYRLDAAEDWAVAFSEGWALAQYRFDRYRASERAPRVLTGPQTMPDAPTVGVIEGVCWGRDLINTPAGDLGPDALTEEARALAKRHGARITVTRGAQLLKKGYPAIHAVGRASATPPALIDIRWGEKDAPKLSLVGKGVCFDSGGLGIKPADAMALMKKDMGGSAIVLGLAHAIMSAGWPVRLRVLVPTVENSISGDAYRPGDVVPTRAGLQVEIGHTDAEGRVILADALTEASSECPEVLVDVATLTGAARVALGTELPALFSSDDALADAILSSGLALSEPLWRMPLYTPYDRLIDSSIADVNNAGKGRFGGAITAALFLRRFAMGAKAPGAWAHLDVMGWNLEHRPGRPVGGEAMALRPLWHGLRGRFCDR